MRLPRQHGGRADHQHPVQQQLYFSAGLLQIILANKACQITLGKGTGSGSTLTLQSGGAGGITNVCATCGNGTKGIVASKCGSIIMQAQGAGGITLCAYPLTTVCKGSVRLSTVCGSIALRPA